MKNVTCWFWTAALAVCLASALISSPASADNAPPRSWGQLAYVPIYPSVYIDQRGRDLHLASTLSIRNTDPRHKVVLVKADYFDSHGKPAASYIDSPITLDPLASTRLLVKKDKQKEKSDGAAFLVEWTAQKEAVLPPIIESITIGAEGTQGISFLQNGRVLEEKSPR